MRLGFSLPQLGRQAIPENLIKVAEHAETLGYDSVWVLERLLYPINPREPYPASADGKLPETYQHVLDPIETLAFVAANTNKVRLGTSVLVLPYHNPVILARRIATLDVLSHGRAEIGVGVGWSTDEFEAAGVPFERRGARSDEFLHLMIALWTEDPVSFKGEFFSVPESKIGPKPVQRPHPPIYIAGYGKFTLERAVKYGTGWNPAGVPSFDWLKSMADQLRDLASKSGRRHIEIVLRAFPHITDNALGEGRQFMTGSLEEIKADVRKLDEAGVTEVIYAVPEIGFANSDDVEPGMVKMEQLMEISR